MSKYTYLGKFELDYTLGYNTDPIFVPEGKTAIDNNYTCNFFMVDDFIVSNDSNFDAIAGETNTSSIAMRAINDSVEVVKLWRVM